MEEIRVMVVKYGFTTVIANDESDALEQVKSLSDSDFNWSDFDEAQVIDD